MGNKIKVQLTEQQVSLLVKLPEQGMGYQIVDIKLKDGKILKNKIVLNSTFVQLEQGELLEPSDIETITIHQE